MVRRVEEFEQHGVRRQPRDAAVGVHERMRPQQAVVSAGRCNDPAGLTQIAWDRRIVELWSLQVLEIAGGEGGIRTLGTPFRAYHEAYTTPCARLRKLRIVGWTMADAPMTVVETEELLRKVKPPMSDAEREDLVADLGVNPEAGKVVAETGGVRKVRWGLPGRGKRGGARVIYYYHSRQLPLFLLTA
jgi:hypothetical protein